MSEAARRTDARRARNGLADRYLRTCGALILPRWSVRLSPEPPEDSVAACVRWYDDQIVDVHLADEWWTKTPAEQREIVAHELAHCPLAQMSRAVDYAEEHLGAVGIAILRAAYTEYEEHAVNELAPVLARLLPMPEERED